MSFFLSLNKNKSTSNNNIENVNKDISNIDNISKDINNNIDKDTINATNNNIHTTNNINNITNNTTTTINTTNIEINKRIKRLFNNGIINIKNNSSTNNLKHIMDGRVRSLKEFYEDLHRYLTENKCIINSNIEYILNPNVKQLVKVFNNDNTNR